MTNPQNAYTFQIDAQTEVLISAVSWANYYQKVNVNSDVEFKPGIRDVAFTGTGEGQAMTTDTGDSVLAVAKGQSRVLTLTFLFKETKPEAWWDYKPSLGVKSFYPVRGRVANVGPGLDLEVVGTNDDNGHSDYNDCVVFVAKYVGGFNEDVPAGGGIEIPQLIRRAPSA